MTTKLGGVTLTVWSNDVAGSIDFYVKLGFHRRATADGSGDLARDAVHVHVLPANEGRPHGTVHFTIAVDRASTFRRELTAAGIPVADEQLSGHGSLLGYVVRDPNGVPLGFEGFNN